MANVVSCPYLVVDEETIGDSSAIISHQPSDMFFQSMTASGKPARHRPLVRRALSDLAAG